MRKQGTWTNGKITVSGTWEYYRPGDVFHIWLDSRDPVTGSTRHITSHRDEPEWGNFKRVPDSNT